MKTGYFIRLFLYRRAFSVADLSHTVRAHFLVRFGLFFELPESAKILKTLSPEPCTEKHLQALDVMLADKYNVILSKELRDHLGTFSVDELQFFSTWFEQVWKDYGQHARQSDSFVPLFGDFPNNIPEDMDILWIKRFLTFFANDAEICPTCGQKNTRMELEPCHHVVCMHCFAGHTGCPLCGRPIDVHSAFLNGLKKLHDPDKKAWNAMTRLSLGNNLEEAVKEKFVAITQIAQAVSSQDTETLKIIISEYPNQIFDWLPSKFASRQAQAVILGALLQQKGIENRLPDIRHYLKNATDVLRMLAVLSGEDGTLMPHSYQCRMNCNQIENATHLSPKLKTYFDMQLQFRRNAQCVWFQKTSYRFELVKMSRRMRRLILEILNSFDENALNEDFMRHRALWVYVGEYLHPGDYEKRFPRVAQAFATIRKKLWFDKSQRAPRFRTWRSRLEQAIAEQNSEQLEILLMQRPGEFARHLDRVLRGFCSSNNIVENVSSRFKGWKKNFIAKITSGTDIVKSLRQVPKGIGSFFTEAVSDISTKMNCTTIFSQCIPRLSTPMLVQLWGHFGARKKKLAMRIFYPAGKIRKIYWKADTRFTIMPAYSEMIREAIAHELLRRFSEQPAFSQAIVDDSLKTLTFPFNERNNNSQALQLSPGSSLQLPPESENGKLRLFLHWCQKKYSRTVDLDLSVAFFKENWEFVEGCTYYQLNCSHENEIYAKHSGDFREAPYPRGASEYVDLNRQVALSKGIRYAVMLVQVYAGVSFETLERAYAGVMYRSNLDETAPFDPLTVRFKYALDGQANGYIPLLFDLKEERLHNIQCYLNGARNRNVNLESNKELIGDIAKTNMAFFSGQPRTMRYDIALLQAAARSSQVWIRNENGSAQCFTRDGKEDLWRFYRRLVKRSTQVQQPGAPTHYKLDVNENGLNVAEQTATEAQPEAHTLPEFNSPSLAFLMDGNLKLKEDSEYYVIFKGELQERFSWQDIIAEQKN